MGLKELRHLSAKDANMLTEAKHILEAKEALVSLKVSEYPHGKQNDRKKHFDFIKKIACKDLSDKPIVTTESIAKSLARRLSIG